MAKTFTERLQWCMQHGDLTVADVARLFGRERRTVSDWVHQGRLPTGARVKEALADLAELEAAIREKRGFPVPSRLSKRNRVAYIVAVGEGKLERARVLAEASAT